MGDVEDVDLVQRARQGDGAAFGALVRPHLPAALRLARAITASAADAEDALPSTDSNFFPNFILAPVSP